MEVRGISGMGEASGGSAPAERIDDLLTHDLTIIQSDDVFSFSLDAVLLARFCTVPAGAAGRVLDLCTGNGVVPLLLSTRTRARIDGVEIQERPYGMAVRSVAMNGLAGQIAVHLSDLRLLPRLGLDGMAAVAPEASCGAQSGSVRKDALQGGYDLVTVNPPYLPVDAGVQNGNPHRAVARHEVMCTLDDVVSACSRMVKDRGRVAMVHRPARLADIFAAMKRYRLEPKRLRFAHPRAGSEANIVLIEAMKEGKPELRLLPPLIVHEEDGSYCPELQAVFYGRSGSLNG